jgi:hypothetical protein
MNSFYSWVLILSIAALIFLSGQKNKIKNPTARAWRHARVRDPRFS